MSLNKGTRKLKSLKPHNYLFKPIIIKARLFNTLHIHKIAFLQILTFVILLKHNRFKISFTLSIILFREKGMIALAPSPYSSFLCVHPKHTTANFPVNFPCRLFDAHLNSETENTHCYNCVFYCLTTTSNCHLTKIIRSI